jgi:hypothetical protein
MSVGGAESAVEISVRKQSQWGGDKDSPRTRRLRFFVAPD